MIGKERLKKILSVAVHNHYKRIYSKGKIDDIEIQKSNRDFYRTGRQAKEYGIIDEVVVDRPRPKA